MKTKKIRARTLLCVIVALVIAMGSVSAVSAKVTGSSVDVSRISDTCGYVIAETFFHTYVDVGTANITLQEKYNNTWRTATGIPIATTNSSGMNTIQITISSKFTLLEGRIYRAKVTFSDAIGSTHSSTSFYSAIF